MQTSFLHNRAISVARVDNLVTQKTTNTSAPSCLKICAQLNLLFQDQITNVYIIVYIGAVHLSTATFVQSFLALQMKAVSLFLL
jgi:hypothetical protein